MKVEATCTNCGYAFTTSSAFVGTAVRMMSMGNKTNCPRCGGVAAIRDFVTDATGQLHYLRHAYELLRAENVTREELNTLRSIVERASAGQLDQTETATALAKVNSSLAKLVTPTNPAEFHTMMQWIVALIGILLLTFGDKGKELTQEMIDRIKQEVHSHGARVSVTATAQPKYGNPAKARAEKPQSMLKRKPTKAWKNSACLCGSGRRQRECCDRISRQ